MPLENDLSKILIIGSGPTLIGSVAEMDLLATDAIEALTEEGIEVVIVNPNPATISTDKRPGVTVYLEPMTLDFLKRILRMEEPDAIMTAYGSTTALKVAHKLIQDGILQQMDIKSLTLNPRTLVMGNQQKRTAFLQKLGVDVNRSWKLDEIAHDDFEVRAKRIQDEVSFPVLVTKYHKYVHNEHLGFKNAQELMTYFKNESQSESFSWKHYRLTEDLSSWEEVIVNIIRDKEGNIVFVNFADSIEPVAINSGDSATVMPSLTLNNDQIQEIRQITKEIASELDVLGILSIHFAVKFHGTQIQTKVLTIKPRLTRSSVWIQRAGLYSVGYIVSKVAIGYMLNEITDPLSGLNAPIEPTLDAIAIKMPYWSLSNYGSNHYKLGKAMQASGEAMGIGRNFETAFLKGLYSTIDIDIAYSIFMDEFNKDINDIKQDLSEADEMHLIKLLAPIAKEIPYSEIQDITHLHPIYYQKLRHLVKIAIKIHDNLSDDLLEEAKNEVFQII